MNKEWYCPGRQGSVWWSDVLLGVVKCGDVREGMARYKRHNRELLKELCIEHLGGKRCRYCGVDWLPICCYDFHHNKGAKEEGISKILGRKRKMDEELKNELGKCIVLCANCHRQVNNRLIKFA